MQPRMHRGGHYPLPRAATTVLLRELSMYILIGDMYAGIPATYTTFFGYKEIVGAAELHAQFKCWLEQYAAVEIEQTGV